MVPSLDFLDVSIALKLYFNKHFWSHSYLACGHEKGEEEDERALSHRQPVGLQQGEEDGSIQAGFGRAADEKGVFLNQSARGRQNTTSWEWTWHFTKKAGKTQLYPVPSLESCIFLSISIHFPISSRKLTMTC